MNRTQILFSTTALLIILLPTLSQAQPNPQEKAQGLPPGIEKAPEDPQIAAPETSPAQEESSWGSFLFYYALPLGYLSLAVYLREGLYQKHPHDNWAGPVHGITMSSLGGGAITGTIAFSLAAWLSQRGSEHSLGVATVGFISGFVVGALSSGYLAYRHRDRFNASRGLYYGSAAPILMLPLYQAFF